MWDRDATSGDGVGNHEVTSGEDVGNLVMWPVTSSLFGPIWYLPQFYFIICKSTIYCGGAWNWKKIVHRALTDPRGGASWSNFFNWCAVFRKNLAKWQDFHGLPEVGATVREILDPPLHCDTFSLFSDGKLMNQKQEQEKIINNLLNFRLTDFE